MDIRCERCATEYELDDAQVPEAGVAIKCATCGHVFKVFKPAAPPEPQVTVRLFRNGAPNDLPCPDEDTLVTWIRERRVLRTDAISFDGATWTPLGEVPELADAFAAVAEKPKPAPAPPPPPAPPAPALPSFNMETDATVPDLPLPKFTVPTFSLPSEPPPAKPPAASAPPAGTGPALPSFSLPGDTTPSIPAAPPPPAVSAPKAAAKETAPVKSQGATKPPPSKPVPSTPPPGKGMSRPIDKAVTEPPKTRTPTAMKPAPAPASKEELKRPAETTGDEIAAFRKQGQGGRIAAGVVALGILGGGGWYGYHWYTGSHIPEAAKAPFAAGRTAYLTDTRAKFAEAEADYQKAIDSSPAPYAEAYGGLAELHATWGEQLWDKAQPLVSQATEKNKAHQKAPEDKALAQEAATLANSANALQKDATDHLQKAFDFASKALQIDNTTVSAHRALLDYHRILNESDPGQKEVSILTQLKAKDPETEAHVAAFDALDAKQLKSSESTLKSTLDSDPAFVRAWTWLAEVHRKEGNVAAEISDLTSQEKAAQGHEGAAETLALLKPGAAAGAAATTTAAETGAKEEKAAQPQVATATESGKTEKAEKAEARAEEKAAKAPVDVDKLVKEGDHFVDKGKFAKALDAYDKALQERPTSVDANFGRGYALDQLRRYDQAVDSYKRVLQLSPKFGDAMIALAEVYKKQGRKQDAVRYYQQYLNALPSGPQAAAAKANLAALQ